MLVMMRSALVPLNDALRDAHESLAVAVRDEIARREKLGVPLDDDTDFAAASGLGLALGEACDRCDGAAVREEASKILAMCSGGLRELDPYEPSEEYDGISIRLNAVSEGQRIATQEAIAAAGSTAARHAVLGEYVGKAICEIRGLENESGPIKIEGDELTEGEVALLDRAGLISDLWSAAKHFADLPASKKKHYGSAAPLTSPISSAAPAPSSDAGSLAATATPAPVTDSQTTSQTPAPAGMS
jgi:hypothetical protein